MAFTDINSEDRLVQKTFADHLEKALGWESVYAWSTEVFGRRLPSPLGRGTKGEGGADIGEGVCDLGRTDTRDLLLPRLMSGEIPV